MRPIGSIYDQILNMTNRKAQMGLTLTAVTFALIPCHKVMTSQFCPGDEVFQTLIMLSPTPIANLL